jgi:hypothetical protein
VFPPRNRAQTDHKTQLSLHTKQRPVFKSPQRATVVPDMAIISEIASSGTDYYRIPLFVDLTRAPSLSADARSPRHRRSLPRRHQHPLPTNFVDDAIQKALAAIEIALAEPLHMLPWNDQPPVGIALEQ